MKVWHYKFKFKSKCKYQFDEKNQFDSVQKKNIIIQSVFSSFLVQFKLVSDIPTALAGDYHTRESPSLMQCRR